MIYLQTAFDLLMARAAPLPSESAALKQAAGQVLADDIRTPLPVPHFRRAMMDGFAVHTDDVESATPDAPVRLRITGETVAGDASDGQGPQRGEAWKIATGAPVPDRTDGVVPIEWTRTPDRDDGDYVDIIRPLTKSNVAPPGEDLPAGRRVLTRGTPLHSPELGLLAALGIDRVPVYRRPRVALLVTGDELVPPGQPLAPGQIYNSNEVAMHVQVEEAGGRVVYQGRCKDDRTDLQAGIDRALDHDPDVILSSGGVSVGERDLVRAVWASRGARELFWRIAIKPGKPVLAAELPRPEAASSEPPIRILGLSGTPSANMVGCRLLARPLLRKLGGHQTLMPPRIRVRLTEGYPKAADMTRLLWATISGTSEPYAASLAPVLESAKLEGLCRANGLVIMPQGTGPWEAGTETYGLRFDWPTSASTFRFEPEEIEERPS